MGNERLRKRLDLAEVKAKKRIDSLNVNLDLVSFEEKKANQSGYGLYKVKDTNTASFTQIINENIVILVKKGYLTNAEMSLIFHLVGFCEYSTNAIIHPKTKQFMSISEIADLLGKHRVNVSDLINALLEKGIIYEFVNAQELREHGRPVSERPLFFNPEIIFSGDRNKINATLCKLSMQFDRLEKKGVLLEWKIWHESGRQNGKLVRRKTYLKYKKAVREANKKSISI